MTSAAALPDGRMEGAHIAGAPPAPEPEARAALPEAVPPEPVSVDFLLAVLAAVARMAQRSSRRQADLQTALRGDGIVATPGRISACARHLERLGYVRNVLELQDGGILLNVTSDGFDRLRLTPHGDPARR